MKTLEKEVIEMIKNSGLNGYDIAQAVVGFITVGLTLASIVLGHKGSQVRFDQYQTQFRNLNNQPKT